MSDMVRTEPSMEADMAEPDIAVPPRDPASSREKVFHFSPRSEQAAAETPVVNERRDWGAAIDLVKEASEAIRFAEERAQAAEDYSTQLTTYHKEQLKAAEARIAAAERRAEVAQLRATEAESWLSRFHDAINEGFGRFTKG